MIETILFYKPLVKEKGKNEKKKKIWSWREKKTRVDTKTLAANSEHFRRTKNNYKRRFSRKIEKRVHALVRFTGK